ncbi:TetR family transcriptional regulator [Sneathiella chungangensis]|uniref:TetR family transcriptional regulator n=1 Tax=Sneathiella chungangensis TaxID=1418234 RepID=A0A845MDA3_9PROT|nr:TetR family transcriptional regulator [Sneathiella chungangensis]
MKNIDENFRKDGSVKKSLKERNRERREKWIVEAASNLFRDRGYQSTRIEDIAEAAEVSPGTVYSYFETKENILLAILLLHRKSIGSRRLRVVDSPPNDLTEAMILYEKERLWHATRYLDRPLWRRIAAAGIMSPWSALGKKSIELDTGPHLERLKIFSILADRGLVPAGFQIERAAEVLRAVSLYVWLKFLREDITTLEDAQDEIEKNVRMILRD